MKIDKHAIKSHPLLALIPPFTLRKLLTEESFSEYPKGTVVVCDGDPCDAIYLIISGRCEMRHKNGHGGQKVIFILGPGDTFGESALLNLEPYRSTVTVVTRSVLLKLHAEVLQKLFAKKPSFAGKFTRTAAEIVHERRSSSRVRRVVSLSTLSSRIEDRFVVGKLATALGKMTRQEVLVIHFGLNLRALQLKDWATLEPTLNGEFGYAEQLQENENGHHELSFHTGDDAHEPAYIAPMISHCGKHFDFVLLHICRETPVSTATECMIESDLAYVFIESETKNFYDFQLLIRDLCTRANGNCSHIKPVLYLDKNRAAAEFNDSLHQAGHPVHDYVHGFPNAANWQKDPAYSLHVNRLAREIARCRVGLALSSGAAKGMAHIGVIQVLEENGIEIDVIAGSSMGAYVGAVWALGKDGATLEKIAREIEGRWGILKLLDLAIPPRQGFLRTDRAIKRLRNHIGKAHFSDLVRPFRVVATYLHTMERIVFSSGEVADAVQASIAIPGICVPVILDGETFIDGGVSDPLPVDVLREMGIEVVIAVNTIPTPERIRRFLDANLEPKTKKSKRGGILEFLNRHLNYLSSDNVIDIMGSSIHGAQTRLAEASSEQADIVLRPISIDTSWHDFANPGKYITLGRKIAEDHLAEIQSLVRPKTHEEKTPKFVRAA